MITYLKSTKYHCLDIVLFDSEKLCRINIFREENCDISEYDNLEDFNHALNYDFKEGYVPTTKAVFDEEHKGFAIKLNKLTKHE